MGGQLMTALMEPPSTPRVDDRPPRREPSVVRGLWKAFAALLVIGAFVSGTFQIVTLLAHEERTVVTSYPVEGITRISVDNSAGSVRIVASEGDTIEVTAKISDGLRSTGESQGVFGDTLELRGTCPNFGSDWCRVSYEISAPASLDLTLDVDDGSIDLAGITGDVDVDTDNGSIEMASLSGSIRATNDNGRIEGDALRSQDVSADTDNGRVTLRFAAPPTSVMATSNNGSVEVVVPDDGTSYRLDMNTDNGSRTETIDVDDNAARSIVIRTENGSVTARAG
jgi:hypothetical protein